MCGNWELSITIHAREHGGGSIMLWRWDPSGLKERKWRSAGRQGFYIGVALGKLKLLEWLCQSLDEVEILIRKLCQDFMLIPKTVFIVITWQKVNVKCSRIGYLLGFKQTSSYYRLCEMSDCTRLLVTWWCNKSISSSCCPGRGSRLSELLQSSSVE